MRILLARRRPATLVLAYARNVRSNGFASRLRQWARRIQRDVTALYLAAIDARVPWSAKAVEMAVAAYALSPSVGTHERGGRAGSRTGPSSIVL